MFKKSLLLTAITIGVLSAPVYSKNAGVDEIQNLTTAKQQSYADSKEVLKSDSYAYKTLQQLYSTYGGVMDLPAEKFKGTAPMTRNEAALIFVNILGKIEKNKIKVTDIDKERIAAINDQLKEEINLLTARVSQLESSVGELQDSVSELAESNNKKVEFGYGEKLKVGGLVRAEFASKTQGSTNSNFNLPIAEITLAGKISEHVNYFTLINPNYKNTGTYDTTLEDASQIVERAYIQTDVLPHHKLTLGKQVVPILDITTKYYSEMQTTDLMPKIGAYGMDRQYGAKIAGDYKYLTYQGGIFSRNVAHEENKGLAYVARAGIKPLADVPQFGDLELGGSYYVSDKNAGWTPLTIIPSSYHSLLEDRPTNIYSFYGKYKKDDFELVSEYYHQNNVLNLNTLVINPFSSLNPLLAAHGISTVSNNVEYSDFSGWYIQPSYFVTPKTQLVARFDTSGNKLGSYGHGNQYLAGVNYYLKYPNLKLMFNYINQDYREMRNTSKFVVQTQFAF